MSGAAFWLIELMEISLLAALEEEQKNNANSNGTDKSELTSKQKHQMKHRELFLSRQVETLPATHIRGKCSVTLLNEEESLLSYLNKDVSSCTVDIPLSQNLSQRTSFRTN